MKVREMRTKIAQDIKEGNIKQVGNPPSAIGGTIAMLNKEQCDNIIADGQIHWGDLKDAVAKREGYMHQRKVGSSSENRDVASIEIQDIDGEMVLKVTKDKDGKVISSDRIFIEDLTDAEKHLIKEGEDKAEADAEDDKTDSPSDTPSKTELPKDDELQFFTNQNTKSLEEVQELVGANQLTDDLNSLGECVNQNTKMIGEGTKAITRTNNLLTNTIDTTKEQMEKLNKKIEEASTGDIHIVSHKPKNIKLAKEHYHPQFKNIVQMLPIAKQVMLVGDAGTGKTFVANQIANALGLKFKHISCSGGMSEGMLIGKMIFDGSFVSTDFLDCYENGGVFLLDEMDSADANLLVVLNSSLANGYLSVPNRKDNPTAKRHEDFLLIACCNTFGTGNGSRIYAGRNRLDGATLDRFYTLDFDYDKKLEFKLAGKQMWMMKAVHHLRDEVKRQRLDKVVSTRWIQQGQMTLDNTKKTLKEFLTEKTLSWTDAEKRKVDLKGLIDRFKNSSTSKGAK